MPSEREQALKAAYVEARGYWNDWTEGLLRFAPDFLERYAAYGGFPAAHGPLSPRMCELLYVALDASGTHMYEPGLKVHLGKALQHGATPAQVMQVLQLGAAQGLEGTYMGVTILAEELAAAGLDASEHPDAATADRDVLKAAYHLRFGDWPPACDVLLRLDPGYFRVMLDLLTCEVPGSGLVEVELALIATGLSACFTALSPEGTRLNVRRALRAGADCASILQVLQMTAHLGVHACSMGVPALMEVLSDRAPLP